MPDKMQPEQKDFMIEKIKERPVNKKKLMRRTIITAALAVIFGLIACLTFLILEPIISNWLYPEEPAQVILFPEDQEEMSPEEMLSDTMQNMQNIQNNQEEEAGAKSENEKLEDQIQDILDNVVLDQDSYRQLYTAMSDYVNDLEKSLVTVTGTSSDVDWLNSVTESSNQASGVIVANNGKELLILVDYKPIMDAEMLMVAFNSGLQMQAYVKQADTNTELAIIAVQLEGLSQEYIDEFEIVSLGTSRARDMTGLPVVAMGSPMGSSGSIAYGMIVDESQLLNVDSKYKIIQTDIYGSQNAGGFLFNMYGQLIGVITDYKPASDMKNMITAYGISDLRKLIEKMSNQTPVPYLGITGIDVSNEANQELQVPFGAYVKEVAKNSPAMLGGIQQGDIIVQMGENNVQNFNDYITALMKMEAGQTADIVLMRQVQEEYKEMTLKITLSKSGKEE